MSGTGVAVNTYLYGGQQGIPVNVTDSGSLGIFYNYDTIRNGGRIVLRNTAPFRLPDVPATSITITSKDGNQTIWVAGYGLDAPSIGVGLPLLEGHPITLPCSNANYFSLLAQNDGDEVYVAIFGFGNTAVTPGNPPALDKIGPTITSTSPANAATNIERNAIITITADKALDTNSVTASTVTVSPAITGMSVTSDPNSATMINITHTTVMDPSTTYTVTVTTGVTNIYGYAIAAPYTFSFTTKALPPPPDTTPPTVVSSNPAQNATSVAPTTVPTVTFSEAMLLSSLTTTSVKVFLTAGNTQVGGLSFALSVDNLTMTIQGLTLAESTSYRIDVIGGVGGVTDLAGNALAVTYSIAFTTGVSSVRIYSVSGNTYDNLNGAGGIFGASIITTTIKVVNTSSLLYNRKPIKYILTLKKVGSPVGNVSLLWLNSSGTTVKTLGTIATSSIGTSDTTITVNDVSNTRALAVGDMIGINYTGGDTSSNYIHAKISNVEAFDGTNTINSKNSQSFFGTSYSDYTSSDLAMIIDVLP